jgi:type III pantothenate kinase
MPESSLLIDAGNTRVKWIRAEGGALDESSFGHGDHEAFLEAARKAKSDAPDRILLSSVSGLGLSRALVAACDEVWGLRVRRLVSPARQAGITNAYTSPETLGIDRWLALIAAARLRGLPLVVMDLGTATTLDAVDESGRHLGGLILPGPVTMLESLSQDAGLPVDSGELERFVRGEWAADVGPGVAPGTSTRRCILEGVRAAQIGALKQFLRNVSTRVEGEPALVATGGGAGVILSGLDGRLYIDSRLVFRGMLIDRD